MGKRPIAINLAALPNHQTGVGVFMIHFTAALVSRLPGVEFLIYLKRGSVAPFPLKSNAALCPIAPRQSAMRVLWEQFALPFHLQSRRVRVLINLHYTAVLFAPSSIQQVTIYYDSTYQRHPFRRELPKVIYFNLLTFFSVFKARLVFTLSIFTRNEIYRLYPFLPPGKIRVIRPGSPSRLNKNHYDHSAVEILNNIKLQPRRYILSISTVEPSKNYLHCISAFGIFLRQFPDFHYVIVGKRGWGDKQGREYRKVVSHIIKSGLQERVHLTGFLETRRLLPLLSQAACLLYASLHEGFGIPLLEAMESGVPVITSNVSSMPEVAGNAAILVNPYSETNIAEGLIRLCGDTAEIEKFVKLGKERRKAFSWDKGVENFLKVMQKEKLIL